MHSTFMGLETGKRGVMTQQTSLRVTGHNISNASTTGYSRQVANITATDPYTYPTMMTQTSAGQMGTGSVVSTITRLRDEFVDSQYRNENGRYGYWNSIQSTMDSVEQIVNETSDNGLQSVLDAYWDAWQTVSASPESKSARAALVEKAQSVVDSFHQIYQQLTDLQNNLNDKVKTEVDQINSYAKQIQDLNKQIATVTLSGQNPNDLMDKRDTLIDSLSKLVNVSVSDGTNNTVTVYVGGTKLVDETSVNRMGVVADTNGLYKVVWNFQNTNPDSSVLTGISTTDSNYPEVNLTSGELLGFLEARGPAQNSTLGSTTYFNGNTTEGIVPGLIDELNQLASTLITKTNELQTAGYTLNQGTNYDGKATGNFFTDVSTDCAKNIAIDTYITSDVNNIAAASNPTYSQDSSGAWSRCNTGDGKQALKIAQLKEALLMNGGTTTMDDYYSAAVSTVGEISSEAQTKTDNQDALLSTIDTQRQTLSGVSIDEEMTNMIQFQQAYNAAARFVTTIDEALNTIINSMGIVGRS